MFQPTPLNNDETSSAGMMTFPIIMMGSHKIHVPNQQPDLFIPMICKVSCLNSLNFRLNVVDQTDIPMMCA